MDDGRLYLYGSYDISGEDFYCSPDFRVFSTSDWAEWVDHGISFSTEACHDPSCQLLFAPDCIQVDGIFYQFYCGDNWCEGVATSSVAAGPFTNARPVKGADGDGIDPAVCLDDDGSVYYYWGQFTLRGARLKPGLGAIEPDSFKTDLLTVEKHGFHEGASIRKRKGIYYVVYTDLGPQGKASCLSYATGKDPLGPFEKRGTIIDNYGCDPETWNNHGSIECFQGQWYVFYHRAFQGNRHNRRVCAEPIEFNEAGEISRVAMTLGGPEGPVEAGRLIEAFRATTLKGKLRSQVDYPRSEKDPWLEYLGWIHHGDQAVFNSLQFNKDFRGFASCWGSSTGRGKLSIRLGHERGPLVAEVPIPNTGGWNMWETVEVPLLKPISGDHVLYFLFSGHEGNLGNLLSFQFL